LQSLDDLELEWGVFVIVEGMVFGSKTWTEEREKEKWSQIRLNADHESEIIWSIHFTSPKSLDDDYIHL
jgi:hypothetical protein